MTGEDHLEDQDRDGRIKSRNRFWIHSTGDREQRWTLVNTIMEVRAV
jgi:hypothetical protein